MNQVNESRLRLLVILHRMSRLANKKNASGSQARKRKFENSISIVAAGKEHARNSLTRRNSAR